MIINEISEALKKVNQNGAKFIIGRKRIFSWYPSEDEDKTVEEFNKYYDTEFATFGECWDYAASEENEKGEPWGLAMSANVVEDFEEL